jgi:glucose-1-phosphate thymidylyltransferase
VADRRGPRLDGTERKERSVQVLIPLAGKGTRLRPHTHTVPKPLLKVAGKPVLDHVLEDLLEALPVEEFLFITGHLKEQVEAHVRHRYDVPARFIEQKVQDGTAGAVRLAGPYLRGPVLIAFVDTLFEADLRAIERYPEAAGVIWAKEVDDPQRFGVVVTDADGYMVRIVEKPDEPVSRLANIGLYYVRDTALLLEGIEHTLRQPPRKGEYYLTDAFQYMIDRGARIKTLEVEGWYDCGTPEALLETNRVLLERGYARRPSGADVEVRDPVRVEPGAEVRGSVLGPNVSIHAGARVVDSRLRDCIVDEGAVVEGCDLAGSLVGAHVVLRGVRGRALAGDHTVVEVTREPDGRAGAGP